MDSALPPLAFRPGHSTAATGRKTASETSTPFQGAGLTMHVAVKKASVQPRRSEVVCAGCHFLVPR